MEPSGTRFAWVRKRDGQLVPFDADKISRALFAASESVGRPDAFLARELTDSIVHFLDAESGGTTPTTEQISDLIIKVVRELGQPSLAKAFAEAQTARYRQKDDSAVASPSAAAAPVPAIIGPSLDQLSEWIESEPSPVHLSRRAGRACWRDYSLRELFTRDLVAAQADGLLTLTGLETPLELAGCVLAGVPADMADLVEMVLEARSLAGDFIVLDGPEYLLAQRGVDTKQIAQLARGLTLGLRVTGLHAVINLNSAVPPLQLKDLAVGPLFQAHGHSPEPEQLDKLRDALLEQFSKPDLPVDQTRVDYHLGPDDFLPKASGNLSRLARRALEGAPLAFVFQRPRRPLPLAEGLDRQHPAILLAVGLHLPRLIEMSQPAPDPSSFLQKLGSLARLALSAATQKRDFLRRHSQGRPALTRGFLLERARLLVVPIGLESATQTLMGQGLCSGGSALEYGRQVVQRLHEVLRADGRACLLETGLDSFPGCRPLMDRRQSGEAAGLMPWDRAATPQSQLRAAGPLHATAEMGTVSVLLTEHQPATTEDIAELLRFAWQQTDVVRVRFVRSVPPPQQLTAPWADQGAH